MEEKEESFIDEEAEKLSDGSESIDYAKEVMESVEKEFDDFRDDLTKEPPLNVFHKNYEIHVKTELHDTIHGGMELDEDTYKTLYKDRGAILQNLYDFFLSATVIDKERYNVETYGDASELIDDYCEQQKENAEENAQEHLGSSYFGKDEKGIAYYHLEYDGLSLSGQSVIKEEADGYVIAANYLVMSQEDLRKNDITFLKVGRDITEEELADKEHAIENMQNAVERIKQAKKQDLKDNIACKNAIEKAISENFDGMHLNSGFENEVIAKHGLSRVKYVLSNTLQQKEHDFRFSPENHEWGYRTDITEPMEQRYLFTVESHPAVLNGFIDLFRKKEKRFEESMQIYFTKQAEMKADGSMTFQVYILNDDTGEMFPAFEEDFESKEALDEAFNNFAYRNGFDYYEKKPEELLEMSNEILNKNKKEGQEMPQNENTENKKKWINVLTSRDALLKKYEKSSLMRMPLSGDYSGYTYFLFNDRIKNATQIADMQSDSRELAYSLRIGENATIVIQDRDKGDEKELTAEEFQKAVGGKTSKDYVRYNEEGEVRWTTMSVPSNAMIGDYEKSTLFLMPNNAEFKGSFYVPNSFVSEDTESEEERLRISVPDDFTFTVKNKETEESEKLSAYQLFKIINDTKESDYERVKAENNNSQPQKEKGDNNWEYVSVDKTAVIAEYDDKTLFRMPNGRFEGYCYYLPNGLLRENKEKGTYRAALPKDFTVILNNRSAEKEEEKKIELSAIEFVEQVKGKTENDYEQYRKPSANKVNKFADAEQRLRDNVPEEMKARPNWVVVRTKENADTGRLEKYLIDVHTDKFAESDNPETWSDFDTACEYARENGGVALAYALDGKDGICCIDLDHCIDEKGNPSEIIADLIDKTRGSFAEKSVSGKGVHIFGKTKGMDVRAFSKDGKSEFYQKSHFITMTGDVMLKAELKDFDSLPVKDYLYDKHERRTELKGKGQGIAGLSIMTDRDVVEKAISSKGGETFKALYNGQDLQNNHSNSDMSLMNRLAFWCNGDKEQMLRIFATSGLFRENKSLDYYEGTAIKAIRDTTNRFQPKEQTPVNKSFSNNSDKGGK